MKFTDQSRYCHAERSEASLCPSRETLRCAQGDKTFPILVVKNHYRGSFHAGNTRNDVAPFSFPLHSKEARGREVWETRRSSLDASCFDAYIATTSLPGERQGRIVRTEEFLELIKPTLLGVHHVNA